MMLPLLLSLLLLCGPATASSSSSHSHSSHSHSHSSLRRLESEVDVYHLSALHPSKQIPYHWFGEALAVQGDVAIVGAPGTEDFSNYGMVYVLHKQRGGESWAEVAALEAPSRGVYASFGAAVSIFQGCAFVGAPKDDSGGTDSGAVYYYAGDGGGVSGWAAEQVLKPDDLSMQDYFGHSLSQYRCRHVIVGAWGADSSSFVSLGAAYIYMNSNEGWKLETKLTPGDGSSSYMWFGIDVGMAEDVAVVGAWGDRSQAGTVFIYRRSDNGGWHYVQNLYGSDGGNFGYSLAIQGEVLVVGAPNSYRTQLGNSNNANAIRTGMVYVYRLRDYNHFEFDQFVQCEACSGVDRFGKALAVSGENKYGFRVLIGQKKQVHLYKHDESRSKGYQWYSAGFLESGYDSDSSFFYGSAVAISGKTMMVGVKDHTSKDTDKFTQAGAVIVMDTDDHSDTDVQAIYNSFHVDLYICLYVSILLGIAVILLVPLGMVAQWVFATEAVTKNNIREHRPFLGTESSTSSSSGGKKKVTLK